MNTNFKNKKSMTVLKTKHAKVKNKKLMIAVESKNVKVKSQEPMTHISLRHVTKRPINNASKTTKTQVHNTNINDNSNSTKNVELRSNVKDKIYNAIYYIAVVFLLFMTICLYENTNNPPASLNIYCVIILASLIFVYFELQSFCKTLDVDNKFKYYTSYLCSVLIRSSFITFIVSLIAYNSIFYFFNPDYPFWSPITWFMITASIMSYRWAKSQIKNENASVTSINHVYSIIYNINALLTATSLIFSLSLDSFFKEYMFIILAFTILSHIKVQKIICDKLTELQFQEIKH